MRSPRAGLELTDDPSGPLTPAEAATTSVGVAGPLPVPSTAEAAIAPRGAGPEAATTIAGPVTTGPEERAASDLESFFVALEGQDYLGAFDRYVPELQAAAGGFDGFAAVWKAAARIEHDRASCLTDGDGFNCAIEFRAYAADGTCASASTSYRVRWTGRRHDIVSAQPVSGGRCAPLATTTSSTFG